MRDSELDKFIDEWKQLSRSAMARVEAAMPIEKDCPVCGHVTLMKRTHHTTQTTGTCEGLKNWDEWSQPAFYCYGCGKTFREGTKLEEVK